MRKQVKRVFACLLALVMIASIMPVTSDAASKKASVVTNQKQLKQALKSGKKDIQIKTPKKVKLTIPALKQAKSVSITIDAKNATVTNKAGLKSVAIKDVNAFVESGKKNEIRISDKKISLTVAKQSTGAKIKVVAKSDLTVLGTTKEAIRITIMAKNTTITAKAKVDATLNADATLNLATYKGVLLSKIYEHYGDHLCRLFTYSPISLKSTAGCAGKQDIKDTKKTKMIDKFAQSGIDTKLRKCISNGLMKSKSNYIPGIDDIVDSYWALQTMIKKENI